jgi:YHS domain-containing protein
VIRFLLVSILITLVARAFWRLMDGVIEAAGGRPGRARPPARAVKLARDPVCGTFIAPARAVALEARGGGAVQYFCSEHCRDEFVRGGSGRPHSRTS